MQSREEHAGNIAVSVIISVSFSLPVSESHDLPTIPYKLLGRKDVTRGVTQVTPQSVSSCDTSSVGFFFTSQSKK